MLDRRRERGELRVEVPQLDLGGLQPVDVILRRVDTEWCDPLELRPDSALIADTYGWLLMQRDKVKEGFNILEAAAKAAPDNVEIQAHYGIALSRVGEKEKAIEVLEAALDDGAGFAERKLAEETLRRLKAN